MLTSLRRMVPASIKKPLRVLITLPNKSGNKRKCYICQHTFNHFMPYRGGIKDVPEFLTLLQLVGSDVDNYGCIYCGSSDRERHLFMFFDKLDLWGKMRNASILHIAPEPRLSVKIDQQSPSTYIMGDLHPNNGIQKIDVTNIWCKDNTFDFVICNHVLEHVGNYTQALKEIFRVLKPNGSAILQTPYSRVLSHHFEEENINTDALRYSLYGQEDHVRVFSERQFLCDVERAGFLLNIQKHEALFDDTCSAYYGVNKLEDLILGNKPPTFNPDSPKAAG